MNIRILYCRPFVYFLQLILLFTRVSFRHYFIYDSFFFAGPDSGYLFHFIFFSHYGVSGSWRSNHKNISRPMLFSALGSKDIKTFSLHVSKWTRYYISLRTLLISSDILLVRLDVIFQGVMNALSVIKLSLHLQKSQEIY